MVDPLAKFLHLCNIPYDFDVEEAVKGGVENENFRYLCARAVNQLRTWAALESVYIPELDELQVSPTSSSLKNALQYCDAFGVEELLKMQSVESRRTLLESLLSEVITCKLRSTTSSGKEKQLKPHTDLVLQEKQEILYRITPILARFRISVPLRNPSLAELLMQLNHKIKIALENFPKNYLATLLPSKLSDDQKNELKKINSLLKGQYSVRYKQLFDRFEILCNSFLSTTRNSSRAREALERIKVRAASLNRIPDFLAYHVETATDLFILDTSQKSARESNTGVSTAQKKIAEMHIVPKKNRAALMIIKPKEKSSGKKSKNPKQTRRENKKWKVDLDDENTSLPQEKDVQGEEEENEHEGDEDADTNLVENKRSLAQFALLEQAEEKEETQQEEIKSTQSKKEKRKQKREQAKELESEKSAAVITPATNNDNPAESANTDAGQATEFKYKPVGKKGKKGAAIVDIGADLPANVSTTTQTDDGDEQWEIAGKKNKK